MVRKTQQCGQGVGGVGWPEWGVTGVEAPLSHVEACSG